MYPKKLILKITMPVIGITIAAIFTPWILFWTWIKPLPDTVQEQVNDAVNLGLDGIIVYVDRPGNAPAFYTAGWKDRNNKLPADPEAFFKIASISKLYIAAAAVKLVHSKDLSLDDTLTELLPEFAGRIENADRITLRMLLQHRSGIPDWIDDPEFPWTSSVPDVNRVLEFVLDDPAEFKPGARYDYSNTNYLLIGNILDKTLGYRHQQYIHEQILAPLGLTHTFGLLTDVDTNQVSSGYYTEYEGDVKMLDFVAPGSSMVATARDVGIFLKSLNNGSLLSEEEQAIYSSIYEYGHTGMLPGYSSIARYHENMDAVVVEFVNTSGGNTWTLSNMVYKRIVRILKRQR